jgi:hypothetical protein
LHSLMPPLPLANPASGSALSLYIAAYRKTLDH